MGTSSIEESLTFPPEDPVHEDEKEEEEPYVQAEEDLEREVRRDLLSRHSASLTREALARPPLLLNRSTDNRTLSGYRKLCWAAGWISECCYS
eukprot:m.156635 g.156635  ORF g.156635 m.156635 type:complete len:93 (+) comp23632_c0_seq1:267-545(+)